MNLDNIRSIEDMIEFKYQNADMYNIWKQNERRKFPKIMLPVNNGKLLEVELMDAIVFEDEVDGAVQFEMEATIKLPRSLRFSTGTAAFWTDVIGIKNRCLSPQGCMSIDWSRVSCAWNINEINLEYE